MTTFIDPSILDEDLSSFPYRRRFAVEGNDSVDFRSQPKLIETDVSCEEKSTRVKVAFLGLETSHPFSDARNLRSLDAATEFSVWGRADRVATFVAEHPDSTVFVDENQMLDSLPDVVIISQRPDEVARPVGLVCERGLPVFVNKPAAVTEEQVAQLEEVLSGSTNPFLTGSVLSFSSAVQNASIDRSRTLAVEATLHHDVAWWRDPAFSWQDASQGARGLVAVIGIHAFDVLAETIGSDFEIEEVHCARRVYTDLHGGDSAQILLRYPDGIGVTMQLLGAASVERYEFAFHGPDSTKRLSFPADPLDPFGYVEAASQVLALGRGASSPRQWRHSLGVLRKLSQAAQLASGSLARQ